MTYSDNGREDFHNIVLVHGQVGETFDTVGDVIQEGREKGSLKDFIIGNDLKRGDRIRW